MAPIQVAVLGAGGQVGANLLIRFSRHPGIRAWGICRNELTAAPLRMRAFEVRCGSITDPATAPALLDDAEVIVHCAAAGGMPAHARGTNEHVIESVVRAAGQRRIIFFSSVAVYSGCIDAARNTFGSPRPDWAYGIDKLHLECHFTR